MAVMEKYNIEIIQNMWAPCAYTLKTRGSEIDPERVHWGHTPFRVNDDSEISQLDAECDPELGQSDSISCQVCRKLTNFRVIFGPNVRFSGSR